MVIKISRCLFAISIVSVLALSSRFDGHLIVRFCQSSVFVSVLALSSRFDGHSSHTHRLSPIAGFSTRSVESF